MLFLNRADAGRRLATRLTGFAGPDTIVLGLPRGGVPVALEVARALGAPLDVVVVRKLGSPLNPEYALGAIGAGGVRVVDTDAMRALGVTAREIDSTEVRERAELERRTVRFRGTRAELDLAGKTAIVVDDGIATGSTARAACLIVREMGASRIVLAVPVAPRDWIARIGGAADEFVCLETPAHFFAVGQWYADFTQTTDEEVSAALATTRVT
ncbi:putative phosphoribosyltransferase [Marisediminicola sp. UYEF4]|uniref:phosphoribosyltransferase n=1 Tax=Marisediminicola sp. UYEF4 TaxID=1756384 RepID=UPI003395865C